ncbi:MAG TPA: hypothetical protein VFG69_18355 [Nannocystaceae bacterium]|nr:hypothetical protein [Nannocystaceae bacterium]
MQHRRISWVAVGLVVIACDKPSSQPDSPSGGAASAGGVEGDDAGPKVGDGGAKPVTRTPVVAKDHPQHARFEGTAFANVCKVDESCKTGGCSHEVCTAEEGVITTCEVLDAQLPPDAACGCVDAECVWWSPTAATLTDAPSGAPSGGTPSGGTPTDKPTPNSGEAPGAATTTCGTSTCKPGQECISYYGYAVPKGPKFESCEWRCGKDGSCPKGTTCVTVADGPGRVCR